MVETEAVSCNVKEKTLRRHPVTEGHEDEALEVSTLGKAMQFVLLLALCKRL